MGPSVWSILVILLIVVLLFGTKKLRNVGGDLGSALKGFKKALSDDDGAVDKKDADKSDADFESVEDKSDADKTVKPTETKTTTKE
ncbi:MAG: sec-independent protein translocase protein TatA [Gammaproteobacteria bacterium]|jgi:sec-independent protein translocase protein TatA